MTEARRPGRRLSDLIQTFAHAKRHEEAAREQEPAPSAEAETATPAETALLADFLDALDQLTLILDSETAVLHGGDPAELPAHAERKQEAAVRLEAILRQANADGVRLRGDPGGQVSARIKALDHAVARNTQGLTAMREAALTVSRHVMREAEKVAGDGVYSEGGQAKRPVEMSPAGVNARL